MSRICLTCVSFKQVKTCQKPISSAPLMHPDLSDLGSLLLILDYAKGTHHKSPLVVKRLQTVVSRGSLSSLTDQKAMGISLSQGSSNSATREVSLHDPTYTCIFHNIKNLSSLFTVFPMNLGTGFIHLTILRNDH